MYARVEQLQAVAAEAAAACDPRPVMLCEYAHSMGNSTGNLHEYWACFEESLGGRIIGGFIWDWADQALVKRETKPDGTQVRWHCCCSPAWSAQDKQTALQYRSNVIQSLQGCIQCNPSAMLREGSFM
eukprot:GHRQ01022519.1.p1 GENE.GHRQ01022519.1~~GHRQ01022519.1.p1  ORF type:complete len:128 (+),score=20.38 GHRQ01022519.1:165-548(+)